MNDDIVGRELPPSYQTIVRHDGKKVCPICYWPMADSWTAGCVPGNCSYRPTPGTPEWESIQRNRARYEEIHTAVLAERADGDRRVANIRRAAGAIAKFHVAFLCDQKAHRPLRSPLCAKCQLAARIEELQEALRSGQ